MRILLDTHIFLWFVNGDRKLSKPARQKILLASEVYVSSASIWEIAIKKGLNRIELDLNELTNAIDQSGFFSLPITLAHALAIDQLPPLHRDPFDRMLIAQALSEPLIFLTADGALKEYGPIVDHIK
jgi:PIN domain nuclease of toxin-antitoxin system